jgi:Domain of unknown function (DUF4388)
LSIAGKFQTMPFAEQLQWLAQGQKTGTLVIVGGDVEKRVYFRDGAIISTASSASREYLGHFLISHGYINEAQLAEGMRRQDSSGTMLGKLLVEMGTIGQADLDRMLRLRSEETLFDIFTWTAGEFRFLDGELPTSDMVPLRLQVSGIVLEAVQRQDEWGRILAAIRTPRAIPVVVASLTGLKLESGEKQILAAVNDDRTVEEISLETHASEFQVSRTLLTQVQERRIKVVNPREAAPAAIPAGGRVDSATLRRRAEKYLAEKDYYSALRHYRAARSLDPADNKLRAAAAKAEELIQYEVLKGGLLPTARPRLARPMETLMKLPLSPQDGFLISRLNGEYDVQTLQKISPMPPDETLITLWRLQQAGHIDLMEP